MGFGNIAKNEIGIPQKKFHEKYLKPKFTPVG
jgi:hypothetical protein